MKTYLTLIAVLISVLVTAGEGKKSRSESGTIMCSGQVIDHNTNEGLAGVEVKINELNVSTYTDFDGNFTFDNVKPGEYMISTEFISYKKQDKVVDIKKEKELKINLSSL